MKVIIPAFQRLLERNSKNLYESDYVNYISNIAESPDDIVRSYSEIFFPRFVEFDGMPFNMSFGCRDIYISNLNISMSKRDPYYWSHVIDVGGFLNVPNELASIIASKMCVGWNLVLIEMGLNGVEFLSQTSDDVLVYPNLARDDITV